MMHSQLALDWRTVRHGLLATEIDTLRDHPAPLQLEVGVKWQGNGIATTCTTWTAS